MPFHSAATHRIICPACVEEFEADPLALEYHCPRCGVAPVLCPSSSCWRTWWKTRRGPALWACLGRRRTPEVGDFGMSVQQIVRSRNVGKETVQEYLVRARMAGLRWPLPEGLDEGAIEGDALSLRTARPAPSVGDATDGGDPPGDHAQRGDASSSVGGVQGTQPRWVRLQSRQGGRTVSRVEG